MIYLNGFFFSTSWRSQFGIDVMAPKFAQTLKSSLSTMSSSQSSFSNADFQVRGTQHQTLEFTPTQAQPQDLSMSSTSRTFRTSITQQSLRSNDPTFGQTMRDDHSIIGSPMQQQSRFTLLIPLQGQKKFGFEFFLFLQPVPRDR